MIRVRVFKALIALVAVALFGVTAAPSQAIVTPSQTINHSKVGMQMFMWNWKSLATECRTHLGPAGVNWILVMPPQKSIDGSAWWTHYQPVGYSLESNLGTEAEFARMVGVCNEAGVDVIADAVINHMASGSYNFPDVPYTQSNFHKYTTENNCTKNIENWSNVTESQNCELGSLSDLATEQTYVREKIAAYLNDLIDIGVKGFRIDAAKHIPVADLEAIKALLTKQDVFIINEVIGGPPEPSNYYTIGALFDFDWSSSLNEALGGFNGMPDLDIPNTQYRGMGDPTKTVTMVNNHDTERSGSSLSYKAGKNYLMAMVYTLSEPFGIPMLYSGYDFADFNDSPAVNGNGLNTCNTGTTIKTTWTNGYMVCPQRWTAIKGMIKWHKYVVGQTKTKMWSDSASYGYARGTRGYVMFNSSFKAQRYTKVATGLPAGTYCDVVSGGTNPVKMSKGKRTCVGYTVTVAKGGYLVASVPAMTAIAIAPYSKR